VAPGLIGLLLDGKADNKSVMARNDCYFSNYFGPARIEGMKLKFGSNFTVSAPLQAWDGNTFFFQAEVTDGPLTTLVKFDADLIPCSALNSGCDSTGRQQTTSASVDVVLIEGEIERISRLPGPFSPERAEILIAWLRKEFRLGPA
jgi:hypothetical protein